MERKLSRRKFLRITSSALVGGVLAACQPSGQERPTPEVKKEERQVKADVPTAAVVARVAPSAVEEEAPKIEVAKEKKQPKIEIVKDTPVIDRESTEVDMNIRCIRTGDAKFTEGYKDTLTPGELKIEGLNMDHDKKWWDFIEVQYRDTLKMSPKMENGRVARSELDISTRAVAVVVHYTAGINLNAAIQRLSWRGGEQINPEDKSGGHSAHFIVGRQGIVYQIFKDDEFPWPESHAWGMNQVSFGVEILARNQADVLSSQIASTSRLITHLRDVQHYPIGLVTSHQNVNLAMAVIKHRNSDLAGYIKEEEPYVKTDPGSNNMRQLYRLLSSGGRTDFLFLERDLTGE
ncbi:MAG: peptidoglycan recognition family protein [Candidatus Shapirobacteria bacterium]|jgi:hypothetical protein